MAWDGLFSRRTASGSSKLSRRLLWTAPPWAPFSVRSNTSSSLVLLSGMYLAAAWPEVTVLPLPQSGTTVSTCSTTAGDCGTTARACGTTAPESSTTACPRSATLGVLHFAEKTTEGNNKTRTAITSANELRIEQTQACWIEEDG